MVDVLIRDLPVTSLEVTNWVDGVVRAKKDILAEETPVALIYNGVSHAVMLATPQDLEDFALGFSLAEGIIENAKDLYAVEVKMQVNGVELHCEIASECFMRLKEKRRTLAGKTGCGLCGAENLTQAIRHPKPLRTQLQFPASAVLSGLQAMDQYQVLQQQTGATHASAYVGMGGDIYLIREDVGRHNALDKLVGALAKQAYYPQGFVVTTSRASFEMVQKVASAGINLLVAVSAPTALAVRVAEQCGLSLLGFARGQKFVIYSHKHIILNDELTS